MNKKRSFSLILYHVLEIHVHATVGSPKSEMEFLQLVEYFRYNIGGCKFSINDMYHGVLRSNKTPPSVYQENLPPQFPRSDPRLNLAVQKFDARIHFAVTKGYMFVVFTFGIEFRTKF